MNLAVVGLALLVAWPLYNVALVVLTAHDGSVVRVRRRRADAVAPSGYEPRTFWIVVPCLNEERVVGRTVRAALALAGPPGSRTEVLVVDDGSDDGTRAVLGAIVNPRLHLLHRIPPDARRGKGEALNAGYRWIRDREAAAGTDPRRVAIGVLDGDGRGSANMLVEVSRAMRAADVGAVQCRVRIHNRGHLLAAVQDLEFGSIANASQVLRNSVGSVGLGGNGQFVRLSALRSLGPAPWSSCLVEDLELGLRLHLAGIRIRYVSRAAVTQQGLVDVRRLVRQRTRWAQGNLQCARYLPKLIASTRISNRALVEMVYYLISPWINASGMFVIAGVWGLAMWRLLPGHVPVFYASSWSQLGTAALVWLAATIMPGLVWGVLHRMQLRDERLSRCLQAALAYPAFLALGLFSTVRAIGRQLTGRRTWTKTERLAEEPFITPATTSA